MRKLDLFSGFCSREIGKILVDSMIAAGMNDSQTVKELPRQVKRLRDACKYARQAAFTKKTLGGRPPIKPPTLRSVMKRNDRLAKLVVASYFELLRLGATDNDETVGKHPLIKQIRIAFPNLPRE